MVMEMKLINLVPLNGANYTTWKMQCKLALIREGLWNIVNKAEIVAEPKKKCELVLKIPLIERSCLGNDCAVSQTITFVFNREL